MKNNTNQELEDKKFEMQENAVYLQLFRIFYDIINPNKTRQYGKSLARKLAKAGAEWQAQQVVPVGALQWVRAIDQLPNRDEKVFWRRKSGGKLYTGYDDFNKTKYMELPEIEWLYEPPTPKKEEENPIPTKEEENKGTIKKINYE